MYIDIKKSKKPIEYRKAIKLLEERLIRINEEKAPDLIWSLEHLPVYTAGTNHKKTEILDSSIDVIKTNRGGKITYHGPGQKVFYFVVDLKKFNKDIRKFLSIIEKTIIQTLNEYGVKSYADKKNIGIWIKQNNKINKIAAIGIKVKKWIAYHGFSINISNSLESYKKIIPCGIKNKSVSNLKNINNQDYSDLDDKIIKNFISNLKV
tara:strand:+ start:1061 stop:1681 length:621 start_codon:yes stop_codon:yes gene_type:complete